MEENLSYKRLLISTNTDSCPLKVFFFLNVGHLVTVETEIYDFTCIQLHV